MLPLHQSPTSLTSVDYIRRIVKLLAEIELFLVRVGIRSCGDNIPVLAFIHPEHRYLFPIIYALCGF